MPPPTSPQPLPLTMKFKAQLAVVLSCMTISAASAFTLDAVGYEGNVLSGTPFTINVPGYGPVTFEAADGSSLVVNSAYLNDNGFGAPSLSFDQNEALKVTFGGPQPLSVDFDFVGVSAGENFVVQKDLFTPQAFLVTLQGGGDGAGLYAVSWQAACVPEPTSALLGIIGGMAFVLRRRR